MSKKRQPKQKEYDVPMSSSRQLPSKKPKKSLEVANGLSKRKSNLEGIINKSTLSRTNPKVNEQSRESTQVLTTVSTVQTNAGPSTNQRVHRELMS